MPNRIIKESICTSDTIERLTPFEEIFFYRLIVNCDDYGRMDARPAIIKARLFPLKDGISLSDIQTALEKLVEVGCVELYSVDEKPYLQMATWETHQRIRNSKEKYPAPDGSDLPQEEAPAPPDKTVRGDLPQVAASCGELPLARAGITGAESNPIQSESNPNPKESKAGKPPALPQKHKFGDYGWVKLTAEEHARLIHDLGKAEAERCIRYIDESAQKTGNKNKWRDWNLVLRNCSRDKWGMNTAPPKPDLTPAQQSRRDQYAEIYEKY